MKSILDRVSLNVQAYKALKSLLKKDMMGSDLRIRIYDASDHLCCEFGVLGENKDKLLEESIICIEQNLKFQKALINNSMSLINEVENGK